MRIDNLTRQQLLSILEKAPEHSPILAEKRSRRELASAVRSALRDAVFEDAEPPVV